MTAVPFEVLTRNPPANLHERANLNALVPLDGAANPKRSRLSDVVSSVVSIIGLRTNQ